MESLRQRNQSTEKELHIESFVSTMFIHRKGISIYKELG